MDLQVMPPAKPMLARPGHPRGHDLKAEWDGFRAIVFRDGNEIAPGSRTGRSMNRYEPDRRVMVKVKHERTADRVLDGYRLHRDGQGAGSLLLGLHDDGGRLQHVGVCSSFTAARRREPAEELEPLRPERVCEVPYDDHMQAGRFRHTTRFRRWRPDRDPSGCTYAQLEEPVGYDPDEVLRTP